MKTLITEITDVLLEKNERVSLSKAELRYTLTVAFDQWSKGGWALSDGTIVHFVPDSDLVYAMLFIVRSLEKKLSTQLVKNAASVALKKWKKDLWKGKAALKNGGKAEKSGVVEADFEAFALDALKALGIELDIVQDKE